MSTTSHLSLGAAGEKIAETWLRKKGYRILDRNWKTRQGEIDLVCKDKKTLVFVEVKTRRQEGMTLPGEALTKEKQKRLIQAASAYMSAHKDWKTACRFDFIGVVIQAGDSFSVEHEQNVIDFSYAVGGGHSTWQPW